MASHERQTKKTAVARRSETPAERQVARRGTGRAQKSAARREAILAAALDEFSARGFATARLEDVARRAGVAKGTIYLHFADKEALFQELVRTMLSPLVASLDQLSTTDLPIRTVLERFADLFVTGIYETRRRNVAHLVISEGARFPALAEFYYREVVERGMAAMRVLLERAVARGELPHSALAHFPQLVAAPAIIAIIWRGLFEQFAPLDAAGMMRAHVDVLLGQRRAS
jgi:AcrR family transcriptional regulator